MTPQTGAYDVVMGGTYADLHRLLDRLTPRQAEAIRAVLREFAGPTGATGATGPADLSRLVAPVEVVAGPVRRLSFVGLIPEGPSDLAERSEQIIGARRRGAA